MEESASFFINPIIVTGPSGCGKSYFIRQQAKKENKTLLHYPCRKDRTLRDGRQILHTWAKRFEHSIIWLEGADDLTPESQAFLRRISETHSDCVRFVIECRDGSKLQEPIRSRYSIFSISRPTWSDLVKILPGDFDYNLRDFINPDEYSYWKIQHVYNLIENYPDEWERICKTNLKEKEIVSEILGETAVATPPPPQYSIKKLQKDAVNPHTIIKNIVDKKREFLNDYGVFIFNNGNPWAFLGYLLCKMRVNGVESVPNLCGQMR
jgi:hypothetical protein